MKFDVLEFPEADLAAFRASYDAQLEAVANVFRIPSWLLADTPYKVREGLMELIRDNLACDEEESPTEVEGWGKPGLARKWHYFVKARSLCGGWIFWSHNLEQGNDNSPDNCAACKRKLAKLREKESKEQNGD